MKHRVLFVNVSLAILTASALFSCSPTSEKTSADEYFEPVDKVVHGNAGTGAVSHILTRMRYGTRADESMKDAILEMLRIQDKHLNEIVQQLNQMTNKGHAGNSNSAENAGELLASRDRVSNDLLLEMIRDQNQRLNDVIEQLKILSQNQQVQRGVHSNLVARVNAEPVQPVKIHHAASKKLDSSLNYGKAIQLYQNRQYEKAISAFESLIKNGYKDKLADRCHFWIGVCHFNLKRANQAIGEFTEVLGYPKSDKIEGAYLMIGQCYEQMGARKFARMTYEKMLQEYPRGGLKQIVEKKLALLN